MPSARDVGRRQLAMSRAVEADAAGEACHRPMMVRSVVVLPAPLRPSSTVRPPARHAQVDAVQDVVGADVGVHAFEAQQERMSAQAWEPSTPR